MNSIAAPVTLHANSVAGAPPQNEAEQAQEGSTKKVAMGSTFTGTPLKKVESVVALDSVVEHSAVSLDTSDPDGEQSSAVDGSSAAESTDAVAVSQATPPTHSFWGWCSSFFGWVTGRSAVSAKTNEAVSAPKAALVQQQPEEDSVGSNSWFKRSKKFNQHVDAIQQESRDESQHIIQVGDAWSDLEKDDNVQEEQVRREDEAERERAELVEAPAKETKSQLQGRHGADMSSFWRTLEKEDYGIEHSVDSENLGEYERLTQAQNSQVSKAAEQMKNNKLIPERTGLKHNDDARLAIHEPWLRRETRDVAMERKIHDSPELQMLQLRHRHHRE
jgi:hypothetical protein